MTGGVNDMQLTQVASNVGNYQAVLQFIDNQITMDTGENLRSTYEPSAAQLGTVEIIENNRNTRRHYVRNVGLPPHQGISEK